MKLTVREERWPLATAFTISRGAKTEAHVVVVELREGEAVGRGECVPYGRYGESISSVLEAIESVRAQIESGLSLEALQKCLPAGAARNAVDCALWDLIAKRSGTPAFETAGFQRLDPVKTCFTISLGAPEAMAQTARENARRPLLKLKIGGPDDLDRIRAVRAAAPRTRLVVDANEALDFDTLRRLAPDLSALDVMTVEQPLKAGADEDFEGWASPVPLCADESFHTAGDIAACGRRYSMVNIKLDKTGGLTGALEARRAAREAGLDIMAGCMVATSLAMAPAMLIAQGARVVDLDGPLLLAKDRPGGLRYEGSLVYPPEPELWG